MGLKLVFIAGAIGLTFGTNFGSVMARRAPVHLVAQAPGGTQDVPPTHIDVPVPSVFANPGQLMLAVMYILGTAINAYITLRRDKLAAAREERNRAWAQEDAAAVARVAKEEADRLRQEINSSKRDIEGKIEENTSISRTALDAANNVNAKIAAVGALRRSNSALRREADRVKEEEVLADMHKLRDEETVRILEDTDRIIVEADIRHGRSSRDDDEKVG